MSLLYILHTVLHIGITTHNNIKNIDNLLSVIRITSFLIVYVFEYSYYKTNYKTKHKTNHKTNHKTKLAHNLLEFIATKTSRNNKFIMILRLYITTKWSNNLCMYFQRNTSMVFYLFIRRIIKNSFIICVVFTAAYSGKCFD